MSAFITFLMFIILIIILSLTLVSQLRSSNPISKAICETYNLIQLPLNVC